MGIVIKCETMDDRNDAIARYNSKGLSTWSQYYRDYSAAQLVSHWYVAGAATRDEAVELCEAAALIESVESGLVNRSGAISIGQIEAARELLGDECGN